jgi:hypothetical protein
MQEARPLADVRPCVLLLSYFHCSPTACQTSSVDAWCAPRSFDVDSAGSTPDVDPLLKQGSNPGFYFSDMQYYFADLTKTTVQQAANVGVSVTSCY